jgi:hypothetical protein
MICSHMRLGITELSILFCYFDMVYMNQGSKLISCNYPARITKRECEIVMLFMLQFVLIS